tara:strand:- start:1553 stop:2107 length:555 start_codon:yes stop_codon:yes gene_type:complete
MLKNNSSFLDRISSLQENYYNINRKNVLFKNQQKLDCAKTVCNHIDLSEFLHKSIIQHNNKILIDYTVLKTFLNPDNYELTTSYLINIINKCIGEYRKFEIHINLNTLSISAVHRYNDVIQSFAEYGQHNNLDLYLLKLELYYTPMFITAASNILSTFISPTVKGMVNYYRKKESDKKIQEFFK